MEHKGYKPKPVVHEKQDFGDFAEVVDETLKKKEGVEKNNAPVEGQFPIRVRMPRENQIIGIVLQRYGANRMEVKGTDGKSRNCRVPGRFKRSMWLRPNDIVMVEPWPDDNEKADIVYKYDGSGVNQLRKKGLLKDLQGGF
jgi:translation initiation factor 1A